MAELLDHVTDHERLLCRRYCYHRQRHLHEARGSRAWIADFGWARWWRHKIRVQMKRLWVDAVQRKKGWAPDHRGTRYQILAKYWTGKACKTPLRVRGNTVTGGKPRERLVAAAKEAARRSANGTRHSFYSQAGAWTVGYGITGEPHGYRSDCSQWVTSIYHSCGLPDPNHLNYSGGYTGTLGAHGKAITRSQLKPGDVVLYGHWPHHHVEMYVGLGDRTIGHGSAPVDAGTVDLLSGEKHYRSYLP